MTMDMAKNRERKVRSVTIDDDLVKQILKIGETLAPKETTLSRLLDRAMAEFIQAHPLPAAETGKRKK